MPGEANAKRELALIRIWLLIFNDIKLRGCHPRQLGGFRERVRDVPQWQSDHLRHIVHGGYRSVTCGDLLRLQRTGFKGEFIQGTGEGLAHLVRIPDAAKCDGSRCGGDGRLKLYFAHGLSVQEQRCFA